MEGENPSATGVAKEPIMDTLPAILDLATELRETIRSIPNVPDSSLPGNVRYELITLERSLSEANADLQSIYSILKATQENLVVQQRSLDVRTGTVNHREKVLEENERNLVARTETLDVRTGTLDHREKVIEGYERNHVASMENMSALSETVNAQKQQNISRAENLRASENTLRTERESFTSQVDAFKAEKRDFENEKNALVVREKLVTERESAITEGLKKEDTAATTRHKRFLQAFSDVFKQAISDQESAIEGQITQPMTALSELTEELRAMLDDLGMHQYRQRTLGSIESSKRVTDDDLSSDIPQRKRARGSRESGGLYDATSSSPPDLTVNQPPVSLAAGGGQRKGLDPDLEPLPNTEDVPDEHDTQHTQDQDEPDIAANLSLPMKELWNQIDIPDSPWSLEVSERLAECIRKSEFRADPYWQPKTILDRCASNGTALYRTSRDYCLAQDFQRQPMRFSEGAKQPCDVCRPQGITCFYVKYVDGVDDPIGRRDGTGKIIPNTASVHQTTSVAGKRWRLYARV
ncbi:hypothetical protein MMC12_003213 [Toensbergia leucococca]|nr:hypothetical protein [Toensbergia leucococca]